MVQTVTCRLHMLVTRYRVLLHDIIFVITGSLPVDIVIILVAATHEHCQLCLTLLRRRHITALHHHHRLL